MQIAKYNILGFISIICWSFTVTFSRLSSEDLGHYTTVGLAYGIAGLFLLLYFLSYKRFNAKVFISNKLYFVSCSLLYSTYLALFYSAIGYAENRAQVIEIGLINYLWPALTLLLSLFLFRKSKINYLLLFLGIAVAYIGAYFVVGFDKQIYFLDVFNHINSYPLPYILIFIAPIFSALYSNLSRFLGKEVGIIGPIFFMLFVGLSFSSYGFIMETQKWSKSSIYNLLTLSCASGFGLLLWDFAMKKGDINLISICSYFIPIISTFISCWYFDIRPNRILFFSMLLVLVGSFMCKHSIKD